jgi:MFS transporter, ACS family, hexuronate transporter
VPAMTVQSYAPIFALAIALVPLSLLSIWLLGGTISPVAARHSVSSTVP